MRRLATFIRKLGLAATGLMAFGAGAAMAQAAPHTLLGIDCNAPPVWHCPDADCPSAQVTQEGTTVEMKTRRPFFLDCPKDYHPGEKVNLVLALHGAGSYGNWQRNYFPAMDVKDKYRLVVITPPTRPTRVWSEAATTNTCTIWSTWWSARSVKRGASSASSWPATARAE